MHVSQRPGAGCGVGIIGIGVYLPSTVRENDHWPDEIKQTSASESNVDLDDDVLASAERAAKRRERGIDGEVIAHSARWASDPYRGARQRHVIGPDEQPSDMEVAAARLALADAGLDAGDIDLMVIFSQINDFAGPLNHVIVADKLGIAHRATAFTLVSDCASFVPHVNVATRLIQSGDYRRALVIQSSALSRVTDYRMPSSLNVGDGAVATVLARVEPDHGFIASRQQTRGDLSGGLRLGPGRSDAPWYRGDLHQQALTVHTVDRRALVTMGTQAMSFCREVCEPLLEQHGYSPADIDFFVVSQPTVWFAEACCDALGIARDRTLTTFQTCGHLMPASLPLNLHRARAEGKTPPGSLTLLYSPGAGFIQAAMLYRW
ncbi:MAG: hypothetical protein KC503_14470 [Myxococcales bacterium]|nr:hypothetical protein [Myxococcales bacterium]